MGKTLDLSQVLSCGHPWPYFAAYVRLKEFVFPWGRLYFIADYENPFRRSVSPLVRYIERRTASPRLDRPEPVPVGRQNLMPRFAAAFLAGSLISLLRMYLTPSSQSVLVQPWEGVRPAWLALIMRAESLLTTPPGAAAMCALFVFLAATGRRKQNAWSYALLAGLALPLIFSHWLTGP